MDLFLSLNEFLETLTRFTYFSDIYIVLMSISAAQPLVITVRKKQIAARRFISVPCPEAEHGLSGACAGASRGASGVGLGPSRARVFLSGRGPGRNVVLHDDYLKTSFDTENGLLFILSISVEV